MDWRLWRSGVLWRRRCRWWDLVRFGEVLLCMCASGVGWVVVHGDVDVVAE